MFLPFLALSIVVLLIVGVQTASAQQPYEVAVRGKPLVEGLGFEGVLTVYDETTRMFKTMGQPREDPTHPEWYYYDAGAARITVRARYTDGRFLVTSIAYAMDEGRTIQTNSGVSLGDPAERVVDRLGEPPVREPRALVYPSRGVTYALGKRGTVVGITVYRPKELPAGATPKGPKDPEPAIPGPSVPDEPLTPLGARVTLPAPWSAPELEGELGARATLGAVASLRVTRCSDCQEAIEQAVQDFEKDHGVNRIPENLRRRTGGAAAGRNADEFYVGRYAEREGLAATWLMALKSGPRFLVLELRVTAVELRQAEVAAIAEVLSTFGFLAAEPSP